MLFGAINTELKYYSSGEINDLFFPIHWKSFPGSTRNHHKLCISLFRGAGFRHRFCSSWVVLPHLLSGEFVLLFPWMVCAPGEDGARQEAEPALTWSISGAGHTALRVILSQQPAQNLSWWEFCGTDRNPSEGGKGGWLEECQEGAAFSGGWKPVLHVWLPTLAVLLTLIIAQRSTLSY